MKRTLGIMYFLVILIVALLGQSDTLEVAPAPVYDSTTQTMLLFAPHIHVLHEDYVRRMKVDSLYESDRMYRDSLDSVRMEQYELLRRQQATYNEVNNNLMKKNVGFVAIVARQDSTINSLSDIFDDAESQYKKKSEHDERKIKSLQTFNKVYVIGGIGAIVALLISLI